MPQQASIIHAGFPTGGVNKHTGFYNQPQGTTPDCMNVWPEEWATGDGRNRGGTRAGLRSIGSGLSSPRNYCNAVYFGVNKPNSFGVGVAVTHSSGTSWSSDGTNWQQLIHSANSKLSSCAMWQSFLFQANGAEGTPVIYAGLDPRSTTGVNELGSEDPAPIPVNEDLSVDSTPPVGCGLIANHFDRIILAGDYDNPHALYGSRSGNPFDWDITAQDGGSAFDSSGLVSGHIGEPPTSLISHSRDCLIVGCTDSLYSMVGDPMAGGQVYILSPTSAPLMQSAWCQTDSGATFYLGREGLYMIEPGCATSAPRNVTRGVIPDDLIGMDPDNNKVSLGYDGRFGGIHVCINGSSSSYPDFNYFYTWPNSQNPQGAFFPEEFSFGAVDLCINVRSELDDTRTGLTMLIGGGSKAFTKSVTQESEAFNSHVWIDLGDMGDPVTEGMLDELSIILSENSADLDYELKVGSSAQEAYNGNVKYDGTWKRQKYNYKIRPRLRGTHAWIKLKSQGSGSTQRWAIEDIVGKAYAIAGRRVFTNA